MSFPRFISCLALLLCGWLAGCTGLNETGGSGKNPAVPMSASSALLREGDMLMVLIQGIPEPVSFNLQVDEQGLVSLPYIGYIKASGISTSELSQTIRDTYISKKIYTNVDISASVTERYIYVGGEVQRPGRVIWTPDLTVAKAIQSAGGFTLYAKESAVRLVRDDKAYSIDVQLAQRKPSEDPRLVPGDSLQISRSAF